MRDLNLLRIAGCLFLFAMLLSSVMGTAVAEPVVTVSTAGEEISEGEVIETTGKPTVSISVSDDSVINVVEVRIDGDSAETYEPNSSSFSTSTSLDTSNGNQDVNIIVKSDSVKTFKFNVVHDSIPPVIEYTSPIQRYSGRSSPSNITVDGAYVNLSGNISDTTGVSRINIRRTYNHSSTSSSGQSVRTHRTDNPQGNFSRQLFLGSGENDLRVRYTDKMGNIRRHEFTITVSDSESPKINLTVPNETSNQQARVQATITDNVQLQSVTVERPDETKFRPITGVSPELDPDTLSANVDRQIRVAEGKNNISITATDRAGNSASESTTVVYNRQIKPNITIHRNQTQIINGNLSLRSKVVQGEVTRVSVEAVDSTSMDIVDFQLLYTGSKRERINIDEKINLGSGRTRVQIIAVDSEGKSHSKTLLADSESEKVFLNASQVGDRSQAQTATETRNTSDIDSSTPGNTDMKATIETPQAAPTPTTDTASETTKTVYNTKVKTVGVSVINASVNKTQVQLGEAIRISALVGNTQEDSQTVTIPLVAGGEVLSVQSKTVSGDSTKGVSFNFTPNETGSISLRVGDASAGEITIGEESNIIPLSLIRNVLTVLGVTIVGGYIVLKLLAIYLGY